jgi:exonuclease VII large subunit
MERLEHRMIQLIEHKSQQLKHAEALLLQNSPLRKLEALTLAYTRLEEEYRRAIGYTLSQFESTLPFLKEQFQQGMALVLRHKAQQAEHMYERWRMHNPEDQYKEGWAAISKEGKRVTLDQIDIEETFVLEDRHIRMEAVCLNKKSKKPPPVHAGE